MPCCGPERLPWPAYVSVGHLVDLPSAVKWTLACHALDSYRLPEPLRVRPFSASNCLKRSRQRTDCT